MTNVLVIGASGAIARHVVADLAGRHDMRTTLYLRNAARISDLDTTGMKIVEGDVTDTARLTEAMQGQDIVYANLTGEMDILAQAVLDAMNAAGVKRLIFVTSLGIYDEVPGKFGDWNRREIGAYLPPFRRAADLIEATDLDYTILRPAWLTDRDEVEYETTTRNEPFKGTEVSRKSVAAYILTLLEDPARDIGGNIGLHKPGTEGDKPAFM
ncbi:SDR family oxidoreductase [Paracoccus fistulariae]|uniref:SDR family oxidoreductase n=1 Tax=Paracoccus fistulariae TaxID=658446 RepID=A0ABY7SNG7_9RHOB|nr:SDR family oxidoreductase [Paracoccus fistulariae]MDB6180456.1 SDR family oxidoreductase [Paracoccus fistulariae]WCR08534.1 SDR family oxidoreductase [Paracoccus fistulariae]